MSVHSRGVSSSTSVFYRVSKSSESSYVRDTQGTLDLSVRHSPLVGRDSGDSRWKIPLERILVSKVPANRVRKDSQFGVRLPVRGEESRSGVGRLLCHNQRTEAPSLYSGPLHPPERVPLTRSLSTPTSGWVQTDRKTSRHGPWDGTWSGRP